MAISRNTYTVEVITMNRGERYINRYTGGWSLFNMLRQVRHCRQFVQQPLIIMISRNGIFQTAFNTKNG